MSLMDLCKLVLFLAPCGYSFILLVFKSCFKRYISGETTDGLLSSSELPLIYVINKLLSLAHRCLEDLDPVVVALQQEIQSGNLLRNALEFVQKSSDPRKQFTHDKDVTLFAKTLAFHGKDKVMNLQYCAKVIQMIIDEYCDSIFER